MEEIITSGARVTLAFSLRLLNDVVVDQAERDAPATFVIGSGDLAPGLERVLLGMAPGERKSVRLEADQGFGLQREELFITLPRADFDADEVPAPGQMIGFDTPEGEMPGSVVEVNDTEVVVDFNHPLAGKGLLFDVEVLAVQF